MPIWDKNRNRAPRFPPWMVSAAVRNHEQWHLWFSNSLAKFENQNCGGEWEEGGGCPWWRRDRQRGYLARKHIFIDIWLATQLVAVMKYTNGIRKYCIYRAYSIRSARPNVELRQNATEKVKLGQNTFGVIKKYFSKSGVGASAKPWSFMTESPIVNLSFSFGRK